VRLHKKPRDARTRSPYQSHPSPSGSVVRVTPQEREWPASGSYKSLGRVLQPATRRKDKRREFRLEYWKCCICANYPETGQCWCIGLDGFQHDLGRAILQDTTCGADIHSGAT